MTTNATPIPNDARYTCRLEWCGYPERRFVVRFCGDWIVQASKLGEAVAVAIAHKTHNNAGQPA